MMPVFIHGFGYFLDQVARCLCEITPACQNIHAIACIGSDREISQKMRELKSMQKCAVCGNEMFL